MSQTLLAAETLGAAEAALHMAVDYAKQRKAFGRAIGSFQAIKHQLTDTLRLTENARSLGTLITFGKFRFLDLGDLTKRKEKDLVCPNNLIGAVDLYLTTHHGVNQSNARVIVDAIHPRVSIMNNGARKGGSPDAWETIRNSPGLQDLWQLHYAMGSDKTHNISEMYIANMDENCEGKYIKVAAEVNGTFTVLNSRNNFKKTYTK